MIIIGIVVFLFLCVLLVEAIVLIQGIPMDELTKFFLPDSIIDLREGIDEAFDRPIIATNEVGLLPLPVLDRTTTSTFGWRTLRGKRNWHEGLDFPVAFGSPVMSVAPGKVVGTGVDKNYGTFIKIEHIMIVEEHTDEDGEEVPREKITFYSFYAHLSRSYVFKGDSVDMNQRIALSGGDPTRHFAGNVTGAHLHFEIRMTPNYGSETDPYDWLLKSLDANERRRKRHTSFVEGRPKGVFDY